MNVSRQAWLSMAATAGVISFIVLAVMLGLLLAIKKRR